MTVQQSLYKTSLLMPVYTGICVTAPAPTFLQWLYVLIMQMQSSGEDKVAKRQSRERADKQQAMNQFLKSVERRAFRIAAIATANADEALDIVQDAMLALVKNYADKEQQEWPPLFHRILQSRIRDWYRRSTVRNKVFDWLGLAAKHKDASTGDEYGDVIQSAADHHGRTPEQVATNENMAKKLDAALQVLPLRQQQAFLLRNWEGLSVRQTADAMSCSESSVKTHHARAIKQLRYRLESFNEQ